MTTAPARRAPLTIAQISLRERENGFCAGGTQVGKSTLSDRLGAEFLWRYRKRHARRLVSDTKPRYRAEYLSNGLPASKLYTKWSHGAFIPGSVLARSPEEMLRAFKMGATTVIVSTKRWQRVQDECADAFLEDSDRQRPQLYQCDETKDHFHGNGMTRGSGAIETVARAGNERGTGGLYNSQRTYGISGDLLEHMQRLYAFRLDNRKDAKRFQEFGCPEFDLPTEKYIFRYWWKGDYHRVWGPYNLLGES